MTPNSARYSPGIVEHWATTVRRRWPVGAAIFLVVIGLTAALVFLTRPVWRAETSLRLGAPVPTGGVSLGGTGSPSGLFTLFQQMTGDPFANELELLSSRTVVEGVVLDNALNVAIDAPRGLSRDSVFVRLEAGRGTVDATFRITWLPDSRIRVSRVVPTDSLVGTFAPGRAIDFGDVTATFRAAPRDAPVSIELRTVPFGEAVRQTSGGLKAERERREANLVLVSYEDPDPGLALGVVTSAAARYSALRGELQQRESGQTTDSLRTIANHTLDELRRQEDALEAFQRNARLVAPEAQGEAFVEREADVTASLEHARNELARVGDVITHIDLVSDPSTAWIGLIAHPTFLENTTLGDLLARLLDLRQQRIEMATRRTAESPQVQALDSQISYLDGSLRSLVRQYRDGVAKEVRLLESQKAELDSTLTRMPEKTIELGRRERMLTQLSQIYLFTDQRLRQEGLRNAVSFSSVQVVDPPQVLFKPVWPRKKLGLGVGLLLALTFGALGMATTEKADRSVRSSAEVRELVGLPVLAALLTGPGDRVRMSALERRTLLQRCRGQDSRKSLLLAPVDEPAAADEVAWELASVPALEAVRVGHAEPPLPAIPSQTVKVGPALENYAAAAELAATAEIGADVVLVLRHGVTHRDDLVRAAALLREAGVQAVGAVVVMTDSRAARRAWR